MASIIDYTSFAEEKFDINNCIVFYQPLVSFALLYVRLSEKVTDVVRVEKESIPTTTMRMEMKKNRYLILQGDEDHCNLFAYRLLSPDDY